MNKYFFVAVALLLAAASCKKDTPSATPNPIHQPSIEKLSRTFVQTGEKLTIYGKELVQGNFLTEVSINGRPAEIITKTKDSIQVLVPAKVSTGKVAVTIGEGEAFRTAEGPGIEIKPTPLIKKFWPAYAYGGDNITLIVENFSANNADNSITLNETQLKVVGGNAHDTILVELPADASTASLHWNTFHGPDQKMDLPLPVRKTSYPVSTVGEWLKLDPAFTYTDTLFRGYPVLGGPNYAEYLAHVYLAAMDYVNDDARTYTIFVTADQYFINRGTSFNDYITDIKNRPHIYNGPIASSVVPGIQLSLANIQPGEEYKTIYTQELIFDGDPDQAVKIQISEEGGSKYVNLLGIYGETNPRVRILREHRLGNATIMEIDGEMGSIPF